MSFLHPVDPSEPDGELLERLLAGQVDPDDAPQAYKGVAVVVEAATAPASTAELAGEAQAVAAFSRVVSPGARQGARAARPLVAAAIASLVIVAGAGVAAATGTLPGSAQRVAHSVLADVGLDVPGGAPAPTPAHPGRATTTSTEGETTTTVCQVHQGRCGSNHGTAVCRVASDGTCRDNHGRTVCVVAGAGRCQHDATTTTTTEVHGNHHRGPPGHVTTTTSSVAPPTTTVREHGDDHGDDHDPGRGHGQGKGGDAAGQGDKGQG